MNTLLLDALQCKNHERPPVWFMRQAGRMLPDYRKIRESHTLEELFHDPELAAHITRLPVEQLGVDAAILFSDILIILEAFGIPTRFVEGKGPVLEMPKEMQAQNCASTLSFVFDTLRLAKKELKVPLIGFAGGPFTVASYLIEGGSSRDLAKTKTWLYTHPEKFRELAQKITDTTIEYLKLQVEAGAQVLQIFDSSVHALNTPLFLTFCLHYLTQIVQAIKNVPIILFCRGSSYFAQELVALNPTGLSFDWHKELHTLRKKVPQPIAIQGNLDPHLLCGSQTVLRAEVQKLLHSMHKDPGFIANLGHGILPQTPLENARLFVQIVKDSSI